MSTSTKSLLSLVGPLADESSPFGKDHAALSAWLDRQPWKAAELKEALAAFCSVVKEPRQADARQAFVDVFFEWFLLDRPLSAAAGVHADSTPARACNPTSPLANSVFTAYLVDQVGKHDAMLNGIASGKAVRVVDLEEPNPLEVGQLFVGRLYAHSGGWQLGDYYSTISPDKGQRFAADELEGYGTISDARDYAETFEILDEV